MNSTKWIMSLSLLAGCQPDLDSLEVGDELGDSASGESADETGGEGSLECLAGTDLAGEPGFAFVPPCAVECAEPLGIPQLPIEWTRELELAATDADRLVSFDEDTLVVARSSDPDEVEAFGVWLVVLSKATGETLETVEVAGMSQVHDIERGPAGKLAMTWSTTSSDWVGVVSLAGEIEWSYELGQIDDLPSQVRVTDEGLAALHPQDKLVRLDAQGSELGQFAVEGWAFDPTPGGGFVVAGYDVVWYDPDGNALGNAGEDSIGLSAEIRALGSQGAVAVGIDFPSDILSPTDGLLAGYELGDPSWSMIHRRSDAWCAQEAEEPRTAEGYWSLGLLGEDRLILGGYESIGYPLYDEPDSFDDPVDRPEQPIVDLVDLGQASASVLARDRGLWLGNVVDVAADDQFAYALTTYERTTSTTLWVRKYATP